MKINVITLFSGYDSQCLALDRIKQHNPGFDYELVAWSEIDKFAIQAHNALYPQWADRNLGDVSKIDWEKFKSDNKLKINLLTYSFPCQDISNAGRQRGFSVGGGTRSGLLWECEKAIRILRPEALLMENVKALASEKFLPDLLKWSQLLESYGYHNFWSILNAKDFGVPQNRERFFMVSTLADTQYQFPKPFKLELTLDDVLDDDVDAKFYLSNERIDELIGSTIKEMQSKDGFVFKAKKKSGQV